jgi:hypothetical protein
MMMMVVVGRYFNLYLGYVLVLQTLRKSNLVIEQI